MSDYTSPKAQSLIDTIVKALLAEKRHGVSAMGNDTPAQVYARVAGDRTGDIELPPQARQTGKR